MVRYSDCKLKEGVSGRQAFDAYGNRGVNVGCSMPARCINPYSGAALFLTRVLKGHAM